MKPLDMPGGKRSTHELLVSILGERKTAVLERELGATTIRIPRAAGVRRRARNRRIVEALRHMSYSAVARRWKLHRSTIIRIAKQTSRP